MLCIKCGKIFLRKKTNKTEKNFEVMDWLVDTGAKTSEQVDESSTSWGNYEDSSGEAAVEGFGEIQESGYSDAWSVNNIYDLAGNYVEFTQEANDADGRVYREGNYTDSGDWAPASDRIDLDASDTWDEITCRIALYIKV